MQLFIDHVLTINNASITRLNDMEVSSRFPHTLHSFENYEDETDNVIISGNKTSRREEGIISREQEIGSWL